MDGRRKTPMRTCCACGEKGGKADLVRIVRLPSGGAKVDPTGKEPGRGAYLHADGDCLGKARKRRCLDRALRVRLAEDDYDRIEEAFEGLLGR